MFNNYSTFNVLFNKKREELFQTLVQGLLHFRADYLANAKSNRFQRVRYKGRMEHLELYYVRVSQSFDRQQSTYLYALMSVSARAGATIPFTTLPILWGCMRLGGRATQWSLSLIKPLCLGLYAVCWLLYPEIPLLIFYKNNSFASAKRIFKYF